MTKPLHIAAIVLERVAVEPMTMAPVAPIEPGPVQLSAAGTSVPMSAGVSIAASRLGVTHTPPEHDSPDGHLPSLHVTWPDRYSASKKHAPSRHVETAMARSIEALVYHAATTKIEAQCCTGRQLRVRGEIDRRTETNAWQDGAGRCTVGRGPLYVRINEPPEAAHGDLLRGPLYVRINEPLEVALVTLVRGPSCAQRAARGGAWCSEPGSLYVRITAVAKGCLEPCRDPRHSKALAVPRRRRRRC